MSQKKYANSIELALASRWALSVSILVIAMPLSIAGCSSHEGGDELEGDSDASAGGQSPGEGGNGSDPGGGGLEPGGSSSGGEGSGAGAVGQCSGDLCDGECVSVQTASQHCGSCNRACPEDRLCSAGVCIEPNDKLIPWGEAAARVWADPASAPDGLIMTEELDAKLFIEQELAAASGNETAGFLFLEDGKMTFSFDPRPYEVDLESIWHTHPGGTSFSPADIGNWGSDPAGWGQWATVRSSRGYTFVLLVTEATPSGLAQGQLDSENSQIRSKIFDYMIQEFGHNSDIESSHWGVFEMARRYNWVYYMASPGSLILERVTTAGPTNETESPGGYPASILD